MDYTVISPSVLVDMITRLHLGLRPIDADPV